MNRESREIFPRKEISKMTNFNRPHLGNIAQCNNKFTALYYFPKYDWPNYKPIKCFKPKLFCHLVLVNSYDWSVTLRGGIKFPQKSRKPPTRLSTGVQSTANCQRESNANFVPGHSILLLSLVASSDCALSKCQ